MAMGSDDESVSDDGSRRTAGNFSDSVLVEIEGASAKATELSLLAPSSHMYPISLELIVERELAARAKRAVFDGWRGLRQLRRRVERRWLSWLSFNGHLLFALVRIWASKPIRADL